MKHRIPRKSRNFPLHRWWIASVVSLAVAVGGVVSWQATGSRVSTGSTDSHQGRVVAGQPVLPTVDPDRHERASRGTPRQSVPSVAPTRTVTNTPAPAPPTAAAPTTAPTTTPAPPPETAAPRTSSAEPTAEPTGKYIPVGPSFSGKASFYGDGDGTDGGPTASGETFDANALTAASPSLPFDTLLNVCYESRCVVVRINDRGPFVQGRVLDLSARAARVIGMYEVGVATVTATPVRAAD